MCFGLIGHLLVHMLSCVSYKVTATALGAFRLLLCCSHARVQFCGFVGPICALFRRVSVIDVFFCCIKCILLGGRPSYLFVFYVKVIMYSD
jgi:hypothetical protein